MQAQQVVDTRRANRQDTYDLRDQIQQDDHSQLHAHAEAAGSAASYGMEEDHSVMEDDSEEGEHDDMDYDDDDDSSLSIPNESIDFDLVYALHSFAATVEGQANVVRGDSLYLMDDSNSYWWLVRVLKTQEVGYIPAENIETPFERLARLNKHRNVDLATATQAEINESLSAPSRNGVKSPSPLPRGPMSQSRAGRRGISFRPTRKVHRYLPAIWHEEISESEGEWSDSSFEDQDPSLAQDYPEPAPRAAAAAAQQPPPIVEEDGDPMGWDPEVVRQMQGRQQMQPGQAPVAAPGVIQIGGPQQIQQQQEQERMAQQQQIQQQRELAQQQQQTQQPQQQQRGGQPQPANASRERLAEGPRTIDPLASTETRKLTVTPAVARGADESNPYLSGAAAASKKQEDEREKRLREEEAEEARKRAKSKEREKMASPVSSQSSSSSKSGGKLRKEQKHEEEDGGKKPKKGMFGGLFKKKEKKEKNSSVGSIDSTEITGRLSEESRSTRSSTVEGVISPTTATAMQQQQQQSLNSLRTSQDKSPDPQAPGQVSSHASQLRQRDQQQQALYQQYLNRSPSSVPEVQPSYGLQSAPIMASNNYLSPTTAGGKPRPGSLIITGNIMDGPGVPELSVVRVFAGKNLQTEATFKTVLLNSSTTASDLIRQATQRFRLPTMDSDEEYYLTIKRVEAGDTTLLKPEERPLTVFEQQIAEALPKVKRSSVGSISSIQSNLSMHPAITKLSMNDFTDDSAVKFYLNRKGGDEDEDDSTIGHGDKLDEALQADSSMDSDAQIPGRQGLTVATNLHAAAERLTSPTAKFALQVVIYPGDLPDDMMFHPSTEAIVFKDTLSKADAGMAPTVSPNMRRKVFMFPKNITVAEVIEIALERFGISEGVVDGGDEIEDKSTKRRSASRVRYCLHVDNGNQELAPSGRIVEAYTRPPTYQAPQRISAKRRSVDSTLLLGSMDDVSPDDPVFILKRAVAYRNSTSRHRTSAPLDELALQQLHSHRNSISSGGSGDASDSPEHGKQPLSRQELIARQREQTRASQRAILRAQANSQRGMDVLLPGNTMLRSSRYELNDRMRYSYVEADGEVYDISDIVEEELRDNVTNNRADLLEGILGRKDAVGEKLNRVLSKIKTGKKDKDLQSIRSLDSTNRRSASVSEYSMDDTTAHDHHRSRSVSPPGSAGLSGRSQADVQRWRSASAAEGQSKDSRPGATTPKQSDTTPAPPENDRRQPSIASVMSDISRYDTPPSHAQSDESQRSTATPKPQQKRPYIPPDDFGVANMLTIIEYKNAQPKKTLPAIDPVDEMLFGRPIDTQALHPKIRDVYAPAFKQLEEMDKVLDDYLAQALAGY